MSIDFEEELKRLRAARAIDFEEELIRLRGPAQAARPSLLQRGAGAIVGAVSAGQRATEAALTGGVGFEEAGRRRGVPSPLLHPWSPTMMAARMATDPLAWLTMGVGGAITAARQPALRVAMRAGATVPAIQLRPVIPAPQQVAREVLEEQFARPSQVALPAPVRVGRPPAPPPGSIVVPHTPRTVGFDPERAWAIQRAENVAAGMFPRQKALPPPSGYRPPQPTPAAQFSRMRLVQPEPAPPPVSPVEIPAPRQTQQAVFPVGGGAAPGKASQFRDARTILNRVLGGDTGDKVAAAESIERSILGPRNVTMRQVGLPRLTEAEGRNFIAAAEGRAQPSTPRVAQALREWRGMHTEDAQEYLQLGARVLSEPTIRSPQTGAVVRVAQWKPFLPIQDYYPRMVDGRRVMRENPQQLAREFQRFNSGMSAQDAADLVVALRADVMGQPIPQGLNPQITQVVRGRSFLPTHLHARTGIQWPYQILKPPQEAIPLYMEQAARERAFLQVFGNQADDVIQQQITRLGPRDPNVTLASELWDVYRGRFIEEEMARRQKQVGRIVNNLATATLLGPQTAFIQASQFGPLIGKFGLRNVARGMVRAAFQGGRLEAERAGTFINSIINEYSSVVSRLPVTATTVDVLEAQTARLAGVVVRSSGIQAMDQFPRAVGFHAAKIALADGQRAAVLGNTRALAALREVGLTPTSNPEAFTRAAADLSRKLNITAEFSNLPVILRTPIGQFFRGLNTFNVQVTRMLADQFVKPAVRYAQTRGREGNLSIVRAAAALYAIGEGLGEGRRFLAGRVGDRPGGTLAEFIEDMRNFRVPTATVVRRIIDSLGWAGTLGVAQNVYQGLQFALSPQEAGTRAMTSAMGAGVSTAAELGVSLPATLAHAALAEDPSKRERSLRTAGRIFFRRSPGVGGLIAPRLFRSEFADRRVATEAMARAIRRGDADRARQIYVQFQQQHPGKTISQAAIDRALSD